MTTVTVRDRQTFEATVDRVLRSEDSEGQWYLVIGGHRWGFVPPVLLVQADDTAHAIDRCVEESRYFRHTESTCADMDADPFEYTYYGVPYLAEDIGRVFSIRAEDIHWEGSV